MLIERPPQLFRLLFPGACFRLMSSDRRKRVFLTFDDGPHPEVTPFVLDTLDRFDARATFFMVGQNIERYPEMFAEVKRRRHEIGSHTLHHLKGIGVSTSRYVDDCRKAAELAGSDLFRPPHGLLRPSQLARLKKDYRVIMYDVVTRDYSRRLTPRQVFENVRRYTRDGSIIVFHDSLKSLPRLRQALPAALEWLADEGYEFALFNS